MDSKFVYKGETLQGVRHGRGQYNYPGGVFQYSGPWDHGVKQGQEGRFSMPGYFEHVGEFLDGQMTGRGQREWADGRTYDGDWVAGEMQGKGSWANTRTNETYDGDFNSNRRHGRGTLKLSSGDIYDGEFRGHRYEGKGAYLKEKDFVVEGYFKDGCVDGTAKATWHKKGHYEGPWKEGHIMGALGQFSATDGSYQYIGPFTDSLPELKPTAICAHCDRTVVPVPETAAPEKGKKETKKPAKGKDVNADQSANTATVTQGTLIGDVHIALTAEPPADIPPTISTESPISLPAAGVAFGQVTLPLNELRRRVAVCLRPYIPPPVAEAPKGGKGKAAAEPVNTEPTPPPGPPVPLWIQQPTLQHTADSWSRFPPNCIKFFRGTCEKAGVNKKFIKRTQCSEEDTTPVESEIVYQSGPHGVSSVALDESSALSVTIPSSALISKFVGMPMPEDVVANAVVVDFCLDTLYYQKMDFAGDGITVAIPLLRLESKPSAKESELGRKRSALTLSLRVAIRKGVNQEPDDDCNGNSKLETDGEAAADAAETTPAPIPNDIDWSDGVWELMSPAGQHEWGGGLSVSENWHSVGLSVKHTSWNNSEEKVNFTGIDLVVDGANRRKIEGKRPVTDNDDGDSTAVVVHWLTSVGALNPPGLCPNQENPVDANRNEPEGREGQEPGQEPDAISDVEATGGDISVALGGQQSPDDIRTGSFVGSISSVALCNRDDMCDVVESTSCFADWVKEKLILIKRSEEAEAAAAAAAAAEATVDEAMADNIESAPPVAEVETTPTVSTVPLDCVETTKATVVCRGGYAVLEGLIVPPSTEEGLYVLEISDDVDPNCRVPESEPAVPQVDPVGEDEPTQEEEPAVVADLQVPKVEPRKPEMTSSMCEMAPRLPPNMSIIISVVAPPAAV